MSLFDDPPFDDDFGAPTLFDVFGDAPEPSDAPAVRRGHRESRRPLPPPPSAPRHGTGAGRANATRVPPRRGRRRRGRSLVWRVVTTAAAFTTVLAVAAGAVAGIAYEKYNGQITRVSVLNTKDSNIREAARQQHAENFLVIGSDSRAGADAKFGNVSGARSDTTILVHLSPDRSKATVISIPRDSWVDIPACTGADGSVIAEHMEMFNSAFSVGGPKCTIATVQKLTGIAVTHFVEIDFAGFEAMVSAMGTVSICSPQSVWDPGSGLRLHPGSNQLDGTQALAYVRARETLGDGSDLGRIKRQQIFLGAVMRQATSGSILANPAKLTAFLDAATKAITVDRGTSFSDLRTLTTSLQGLDPRRVTFYTAPIADQNYTPPGTSMTGRVLLDSTKGRILYDSVINDVKPVWVTGSGKDAKVQNPTSSPSPTTTTTRVPTAAAVPNGTTAAQVSCSL